VARKRFPQPREVCFCRRRVFENSILGKEFVPASIVLYGRSEERGKKAISNKRPSVGRVRRGSDFR